MKKGVFALKTILSVDNLQKSYKDVKALKGLSFDVQEKEVFCLLGPNGAGKTTTINILAGILGADSGKMAYRGKPLGKNLQHFKRNLGVVPQELAIYEEITAYENVRFFGSLYGIKGEPLKQRIRTALSRVGLLEVQHRKPRTFSGGMKRRLNIACGVVHEPELIIFDEPTVGIDPQSRKYILDYIKSLKDDGITVVYTSHYMEEVEEIATRIVIVDHGRLIAEGTKESLQATIGDTDRYTVETEDGAKLNEDRFLALDGVTRVEDGEAGLGFLVERDKDVLPDLVEELSRQHVRIRSLEKERANLERVFLHLTGHSLRG